MPAAARPDDERMVADALSSSQIAHSRSSTSCCSGARLAIAWVEATHRPSGRVAWLDAPPAQALDVFNHLLRTPHSPHTCRRLSVSREVVNPALLEHARQRCASIENRIADRVTASAARCLSHPHHLVTLIALGVEAFHTGS